MICAVLFLVWEAAHQTKVSDLPGAGDSGPPLVEQSCATCGPSGHLSFSAAGPQFPLKLGEGRGWWGGGRGAGAGDPPPSELWLCEWGPIFPATSQL